MRLLLLPLLLMASTLWAGTEHVNAPDPDVDGLLAVKKVRKVLRPKKKRPTAPKVKNLLRTEISISTPQVPSVYKPFGLRLWTTDRKEFKKYYKNVRRKGYFPEKVDTELFSKEKLRKDIDENSYIDISNIHSAFETISVDLKLTVNSKDDEECNEICQKMREPIPAEGYDLNLICYPGESADYDLFFQVNDFPIHIGPDASIVQKSFTISDSYFADTAWARYCQNYPEKMLVKLTCKLYLDKNIASNESFRSTFKIDNEEKEYYWRSYFDSDPISWNDETQEREYWYWTGQQTKSFSFIDLNSFKGNESYTFYADPSQIPAGKVEEKDHYKYHSITLPGGFYLPAGRTQEFWGIEYLPFDGSRYPKVLIQYNNSDDLIDRMAKGMVKSVRKEFRW